MKVLAMAAVAALVAGSACAEPTYAERLGWPAGSKVIIFHVDDAGMSHESNLGTIEAMEKGVATSTSIMFPCSWVSEYAQYWKEHQEKDAGVHLTLTSEWDVYRWGPVAGKKAVPSCTDPDGCLWDNVKLVTEHASADEIEQEIRAQVDRCLTMGIKPTHLDSHMGTLFSKPDYIERYVKVGIEKNIPVLMPGGHMEYVQQENPEAAGGAKQIAETLWNSGLPVVDDIYTAPYGYRDLQTKKSEMLKFINTMKPGITEVILHCTRPGNTFQFISSSGETRLNDTLVMLDPDVKKAIEDQKIILTTWREMKQKRDELKAQGK
jgi:predicted glycoside hydrolase/deacetylase ChbG (UPF0249 family)